MVEITRNNLQLFCRICLGALQSGVEPGVLNIHLVPNLTKLLIICTTLDVDENNDVYPKSLCQLCLDKLQDFESFRSMGLQSAEVLRNIINAQETCDNEVALEEICINSNSRRHEIRDEYDEDDDDQLLLPELSSAQNQELSTVYENDALDQSTEDDDDINEEETDSGINKSSIINCSTSSRKLRSMRDQNKKALKCPRCDKQFYKQVYLDAHIRAVHEGHEKSFLCCQCNKAFTCYNQLNVHMQSSHKKDKKKQKFACHYEGCDAVFKMLTQLETHQKVVHKTDPSPPFQLSLQEVLEMHQAQLSKELEHICHQCFKKYSSKYALANHLKRHENIKEHICGVCGVAKVTSTELLAHMRTHQPNAEKFKCHICPQEFKNKNAIQRHVRAVHEGIRPFACSYCPKRFATRNSKMCHERLHTGERPFVCEICNKSFAQLESLKSHMKNHDKSLRTHVCSFCAQRFITRKNLIDHEHRHRGDKPHICEICSRGFSKRKDMFTHRRTHV